ncbi:hypothetical protein [Kitasatospora sp. NPDC004531]
MRGLKRALTVGALAVPLALGGGLASAQQDPSANFGADQFVSGGAGAGANDDNSAVGGEAVQHADFGVWADNSGVSSGSADSAADFGGSLGGNFGGNFGTD